ncbi:MAG TPA: PorP/SprF family type IX secretion system membrane protein [Chitinophagaceae bacterium]|nr:PorP/SprF family type IX secretion system membrane protein [Chitinophagaceae bacterium]
MRTFFCTFFLLILASAVKAQDPNFSQFFASPLTLNPALTGKFNGQVRAAGNYRNQWPTINNAFTTYTVSADFGILKNNIPEIDQFGIGIMGFSEQSGNGILKNNYLSLSTAYHKGLDENGFNQLGLGFQTSFVNKRLDITNLKFEDQLTSLGFTGVTSEVFSANQINVKYLDVNAGILFNGTSNGDNNYYAGVSMYHINRPKETFNGGQFYLPARVTFQAGGMLPVGQYDGIHFSANHSRQANATNTVVGGAYMLNMNQDNGNPTNIYLGSWFRFGDAVIPYVGLEFGEFHIGATYDVNLSSLKPASNMRGGAEISLIYVKQPRDPYAKKLNCPKF